jgi:hypothetical protein
MQATFKVNGAINMPAANLNGIQGSYIIHSGNVVTSVFMHIRRKQHCPTKCGMGSHLTAPVENIS